MLPIKTLTARSDNYGDLRSTKDIKWLVYHYTGNRTDTALANATYFRTGFRDASAQYFVDEVSIYQSVPDNRIAWAVGSTGWLDQGSPYADKGHKYWKKCTNANSIHIEMCSSGGRHSAKTIANAKELGNYLCNKYNIDNAHVIRHFDVNGKLCPITFVTDEKAWNNFKSGIGKGNSSGEIVKAKLEVDGLLGTASVTRMQEWLCTPIDGWISGQKPGAYEYQQNLIAVDYNDGGSACIRGLQNYLNRHNFNCGEPDGYLGKNTVTALQKFLNHEGFNCGTPDGYLGENTAKAFQRFLNTR